MSIVGKLRPFFDPESVAVVGASRKVGKAGYVVFKNFAENKRRGLFRGELYPVNPREESILGYKCYPSLARVPGDVEFVAIVVPADAVPGVMEEAAAKGARVAVIITSGFAEAGRADLEKRVGEIARAAGIRVLGPNCLGVYDPSTGVDTLFLHETRILLSGEEVVSTPRPMPGRIAVVTQSGAFGVAALDYLAGRRIGVSRFVSFGNRVDVDECDLLEYFLEDGGTRAILLYLEGVRDGRKFVEVAGRVTRVKPVVALKTGRTRAGASAVLSHTGSIAGSDEVYNAAFEKAGVVRAKDMEEFFDFAKALLMAPPAAGSGVAIITDAGGPGAMAADECELRGLRVVEFAPESVSKLEEMKRAKRIPSFVSISNPIDLTGSVTSEMLELVTEVALGDPGVHGVIVMGLHHVPGLREDYVDRVVELARGSVKPVVASIIGETEMALYLRARFEKLGIPAYSSPEDGARAMAALCKYGSYLKRVGCFERYLEMFRRG